MAVLRSSGGLLPIAADRRVTLVNTSLRSAYGILGSTRGIGPNQTDAAFDLFAAAVQRRSPGLRVLAAEDVLAGTRPGSDTVVVVVTEDHPLPGVDFDQSAKRAVLDALLADGRPVQVVALRDPYELSDLGDVRDYLCAFGSRWCSAEAAAEVLFGETVAGGASPVSVPGAGIEAR